MPLRLPGPRRRSAKVAEQPTAQPEVSRRESHATGRRNRPRDRLGLFAPAEPVEHQGRREPEIGPVGLEQQQPLVAHQGAGEVILLDPAGGLLLIRFGERPGRPCHQRGRQRRGGGQRR